MRRFWLAMTAATVVGYLTLGGSRAVANDVGVRCSKADAVAVVKRLHLGEADRLQHPVYAVFCGAFLGPDSQAMVVSLASGGTSVPFEGWAVFGAVGGEWQLEFRRSDGALIAAAGTEIRETVSISRPGDPRCCPSGGTKTRVWRWNGSRFTAGAWKQATPPTQGGPVLALYEFASPSRNIACNLRDEDMARCTSIDPPQSVSLDSTGTARICRGGVCDGPGRATVSAAIPTLAYGRQTAFGLYRCLSTRAGITCTVIERKVPGYGKGFRINRTGVTRLGS